ncbi:MAG: YigZ family protein [Bacteroidales bacterium]
MQKQTYQTITNTCTGIFKEKGSKFIAYAYPVTSVQEIDSYIQKIKKEHHGARHHCWAYRIGFHGEQYRIQDDGEPANSAGKPILGQIDAFSLTQILIIVVRYFGGTLLGVGGLIQAYKQASKEALSAAHIKTKHIPHPVSITCSYDVLPHIMNIISDKHCTIRNEQYSNTECTIECDVSQEIIKKLEQEKKIYSPLRIQYI